MNLFLSQILRTLFLSCFVSSFLHTLELSKEERAWIASHDPVVVGVDNAWEPFDFINENGNHDGMSADYLQVISNKTGIHFAIAKHEKWSDVLEAAKAQKLDMIAAIAFSKEREKYLYFSKPYMTYSLVLATAKKETFFYEISDFDGKRVGVIESYITEDILKEQHPNIEVVTYPNLDALLAGLALHEVDAIFDNAVSMAYQIRKHGYSHFKMVTIGEHKRSMTMGVTKNNKLLLSILNKALQSIGAEKKKEIRDKWVSFDYDKTIDYTLVYQILGIFAFFLLGTFYWHRRLTQEVKKRKESEAQMSVLIENIPLNMIVSGLDGSVLRANTFAQENFGIAAEDIYDYNVLSFYVNPSERDEIIHIIQTKGKVNKRIVKFKRLDDSEMHIMISIMPIVYDGKNALLSIMVDLTDRIQMEEDLHKAKEEAISASKSKSEFLANMSHEIRTPMNAILGFTELLDEQVETPRLKAYTKTIKNAGNSLLTLINDILDLSKIEAGKLEINKKATNLFELCEEIGAIFLMTVRNKGVDLIIDIDENIPKSLLLDAVRLRQVLVNLIGNAVKFTDEGFVKLKVGTLKVDEHLSKIDLVLSVEDSGIGIPQSQIHHIFKSFEQQEGQDNRKFGGTGLGLSISKRLTEMMDGRISVQSIEKGGTTFFVHLYRIDILAIQDLEHTENTSRVKAESIKFKPAKVLVVDDIEDNRELIEKNFENTVLEIVTAVDGYDALEKFKSSKPDLILMDIRMSNMDGYEAATKLKEQSDVPIIALTASVMKDEYDRVKSKHFDAYLRKPILRDDLFLTLSHFLEHEIIELPDKRTTGEYIEKLNVHTLQDLALYLDTTKQQVIQLHTKALQSNNIEDIKHFSDAIKSFTLENNNDIFITYSTNLVEAIDTFDIAQMQSLLQDFSLLLSKIEKFRQ